MAQAQANLQFGIAILPIVIMALASLAVIALIVRNSK
jgi:hypothetical protein